MLTAVGIQAVDFTELQSGVLRWFRAAGTPQRARNQDLTGSPEG